ncbi:MAG: hypothetical protein ACI8R9_002689 [Paraglaciecola sp.]
MNHTFGRDRETNLAFLTSPSASRNHAAIAWDGEGWQVKDISLNGTYINAVRMPKGQYQPIYFGDKIHFGSLIDNMWEVSDLAAPITGLFPMNKGLAFIPLFDIEILPIEQPEVLIYLSEQSLWVCEINGKRKVLLAGDVVGNGQKRWQFFEGRPSTATLSDLLPQQNKIRFNFSASQDEERVSLNLIVDNKYIDMGQRNHHYILLLLARQRLEDSEKGVHASEQGWIDKNTLIKMSGIMEQHINIHIYRFRKQVDGLTSNSTTLEQIIERRPGELRFAYSDICIEGGCSMAKSI